ncbi:DUF3253 domain-containing protein [Sphingobacterium corticibacter]|uniref:DUF3253 domain-containing protein n=1 Tax=Sphingobacterium corticibacter TaxID=2171749 RepID=A0A2T8HIB7_9SPHI|nr:DUF3253 domain-containing protein [Sphingobacterium corticibacter]PVH25140.1 DUF3253 domain-containing protein [Sphingobacterium corticibacter]
MSLDPEIVKAILSTTAARGADKSICPSEVARQLYPDNWRDRMQDVVEVAIALHRQGKVVIVQHGEPVDVNQIKGPIRIKTT